MLYPAGHHYTQFTAAAFPFHLFVGLGGGGIDNQRHIFGNTEKPCVGNDQRDMSAIAVKGQEMRWRGMGFSFSFIPLVKCGSDEKPAEIRVFQ